MNLNQLQQSNPNIMHPFYTFFSPGRINLIGEHVDNYGGHVFPMAIDLGITGYVSLRKDQIITMSSMSYPDVVSIPLQNLTKLQDGHWANYVIGMLLALTKHLEHGFDLVISSTLPMGAGLSSSASLELLAGTIINEVYHLNYSRLELVKIAKRVENEFIGVSCGIMDQFAIGMGKKNHAMYLDTASLDVVHSEILLEEYSLVIANSNKKRELVTSQYNNRKEDADTALQAIQTRYVITNLAELKETDLKDIQGMLTVNQYKRVLHIVTEETRTKNLLNALSVKDYVEVGKLLYEGHLSLKENFEVSCLETDALVQAFSDAKATGARMIGAGFGGCILALMKKEQQERILKSVTKQYLSITGLQVEFYPVKSSDGTKRI